MDIIITNIHHILTSLFPHVQHESHCHVVITLHSIVIISITKKLDTRQPACPEAFMQMTRWFKRVGTKVNQTKRCFLPVVASLLSMLHLFHVLMPLMYIYILLSELQTKSLKYSLINPPLPANKLCCKMSENNPTC